MSTSLLGDVGRQAVNGYDDRFESDVEDRDPGGSQLRSSPAPRSEREEEEGEDEIDPDIDQDEDGEEGYTRPPSPEDGVGPPIETQRIKLVFSKKRKADGDDTDEPVSAGASDIDKATEEALRMAEKDQLKRMPRKKRKWLKKGESESTCDNLR